MNKRSHFAAMLAGAALAFPQLFKQHDERKATKAWNLTKKDAKAAMERQAHNDAIDAKRRAKGKKVYS